MSFTLREIADEIEAKLIGDPACTVTGVATIQNASSGDLSFLSNRRYYPFLAATRAAAVILSGDDAANCPVNALVADDPYLAYVKAVRFMYPPAAVEPGMADSVLTGEGTRIAETASIGPGVNIGKSVVIHDRVTIAPGCVIEDGVSIGADTRIGANVTLCKGVQLGQRVILHPGVVIGADGFGIANDHGRWLKIPQIGSVVIGDDVEIGANTTIDRGAIENTVIEEGVKIDNQVQIGHNVVVGAHTAIAGCVAVAGSVTIGRHCMIGGLTAINGHINITDNVTITGMSGVSNSIKEPGVYSAGLNIMETRLWRKNVVRFKSLDEISRRLKKLEEFIKK